MTDELKPCPFCGGDTVRKWKGGEEYWYGCEDCDLGGPSGETEYDAVLAWNTRPVEDALRARVAELEAQWASVPWEALRHVYDTAQEWYSEHLNTPTEIDDAIVREWLFTYAPQKPEVAHD